MTGPSKRQVGDVDEKIAICFDVRAREVATTQRRQHVRARDDATTLRRQHVRAGDPMDARNCEIAHNTCNLDGRIVIKASVRG